MQCIPKILWLVFHTGSEIFLENSCKSLLKIPKIELAAHLCEGIVGEQHSIRSSTYDFMCLARHSRAVL